MRTYQKATGLLEGVYQKHRRESIQNDLGELTLPSTSMVKAKRGGCEAWDVGLKNQLYSFTMEGT